MFLNAHYQNAYVTRDLDRALALFRTQHNFDNFMRFEPTFEVRTPTERGLATTKMALGWIGNIQYELIEPVSGLVDVFREGLPASGPMRFHHVCMRVDDWAPFRASLDRQGQSVVLEGGTEGHLQFVYVDGRDTVGHYLEYCWMTPQRWAAIGGRNP
jgi:hypothetical protein